MEKRNGKFKMNEMLNNCSALNVCSESYQHALTVRVGKKRASGTELDIEFCCFTFYAKNTQNQYP